MTMAAKNNNESGQALIEFVLFLPFMFMMYMSILTLGNAINASINQQKITRGFFYYRLANNSTIPRPRREGGAAEPSDGWQSFGMQILGWADTFDGNSPVSPCFKFNLPFDDEDEECPDTFTEERSQFIRTETVYGICGATYIKDEGSGQNIRQPDGANPSAVISADACSIISR